MTPTDPTPSDPTGTDPTGPDLAGDFPEEDLPEPVLPPHHDLTTHLMALSSTVAEHNVALSKLEGLPKTLKAHEAQLLDLEENTEGLGALLDRVAALELPTPGVTEPAEGPAAPDQRQPEQQAEAKGEPSGESGVAAFDLRVLIVWVRENLANVVERDIPTSKSPNWCRQWWRHPEAIVRLEAARRCWLDASTQNANLSTYFQHLDHHLGVLTDERGPFARCRAGEHTTEPISTRVLGQDDPDESFYAEFTRLRAAPVTVVPTTPPVTPAGAPGAVPAPVTGAATWGGGVSAADLVQRRNGRGR
jgi:hypothetical protein